MKIRDVRKSSLAFTASSGLKPRSAFSPYGKWIVVIDDEQFDLFETGTWRKSNCIRTRLTGRTFGMAAFSPDGCWLAVVTDRFSISLFSLEQQTVAGMLRPPATSAIHSIAFSPDGSRIGAAGAESRVAFWHLKPIEHLLNSLGLGWNAASASAPKVPRQR